MRGRLAVLALALMGGAGLLHWYGGRAPLGQAVPSGLALPAATAVTTAVAPSLLDPAPATGQAPHSVAEIEQRLFSEGSLRGSQLDGDWGLDAAGHLQPSLALRQRFDQLLTTLGEVQVEELTRLLKARAEAQLNVANAAEVLAVWQRYLQLLQRNYRWGLDGGLDVSKWEAALAERQSARRELLGRAWADAFFAEEEAALRTRFAGGAAGEATALTAPAGLPALAHAPAEGSDVQATFEQRRQAFGLQAAQRLGEEDVAQAQWDARLAAARAELARLQQAPELSAAQRQQAVTAGLDAQFSGGERLRARALLGY